MTGFITFKPRLQLCLAVLLVALGMQDSFAQTPLCITTSTGDQIAGTTGGYRHEVWNDFNKGSSPVGTGCMTLGSTKAAFSATWSNIHNFLARRGLGYDQTKNHQEIGTLNSTFDVSYNPSCNTGGNSYMGVYGWTYDSSKTSPNDLVEWYIIENWCNWNPSQDSNAVFKGTIFAGQYDVYTVVQTGKPSIKDSTSDNFVQYFSIRKEKRTSGALNISEHFYNWEKLGMPMGKMHEVSMLVEGYKDSGSATFNSLDVYKTAGAYATDMRLSQDTYSLGVGDKTSRLEFIWSPAGTTLADYKVTSSNESVVSIGVYKGNLFLQGNGAGTATITASSLTAPKPGVAADTATVTVANSSSSLIAQAVEFRARGTKGVEKVSLLLNGSPVGKEHLLTTDFKVYQDIIFGAGDLTVEFVNDDNIPDGRDVRLDYVSINGVKRETEAQAVNTAAYVNGVCGGGGYTEWLNCNGNVNFGRVEAAHKITVRARGNAGGEHIAVLVDGQAVNGGWNLTTAFTDYSVTLNRADGDINVRYDNDGGTKDVVIDWVKVDNQGKRQSENMTYNTGYFANGKCGGGSKSEWLHCNGVIGYGKISATY